MFFDNKFICSRQPNWISEKCVQQYMITLRMPVINVIRNWCRWIRFRKRLPVATICRMWPRHNSKAPSQPLLISTFSHLNRVKKSLSSAFRNRSFVSSQHHLTANDGATYAMWQMFDTDISNEPPLYISYNLPLFNPCSIWAEYDVRFVDHWWKKGHWSRFVRPICSG
jgi:hypothetical protein